MEVYPIGAEVTLARDPNFKGVVIGICIRGTGVTYDVVWWDNSTRYQSWLEEIEINHTGKRVMIGLKVS